MNSLSQAEDALREGRLDAAERLAQDCLRQAAARGSAELEAGARLQLARSHSAQGRMRSALAHCQRAMTLFESIDDLPGEIRTWATAAYAATNLRERDQAVAFAARAVNLGAEGIDPSLAAMAHNYMGVAQFWDGDSCGADASFGRAASLARRTGVAAAEIVPIQNHAAGEVVTSLLSRVLHDTRCDPTRLAGITAALRGVDLGRASVFASVRQRAESEPVMACIDGVAAAWQGDLALARERVEFAARAVLPGRPSQLWLVPYVHLARHEMAHEARDYEAAVRHCLALEESALRGENHQMAWLGAALRLRALEFSGRHQAASRGWRELLRDEVAVRRRRAAPAEPPRDSLPSGRSRQQVLGQWQSSYGLTRSESAVLDLLGDGLSVAAIAHARGTSVGTVRNQLSVVFDKTGHRSQPALLAALLGAVGDGR